jgi:hypothetical protein
LEIEPFVGGRYGDQPPAYFKEELRISRPLPEDLERRLQPRDAVGEMKPSWYYPPYLLGWTQTAQFSIEKGSVLDPNRIEMGGPERLWPDHPSPFLILDKDGRNVGRATLDVDPDLVLGSAAQKHEFIMVSRTWRPGGGSFGLNNEPKELLEKVTSRKGPWPLINVILIERGGEFAERRGVGFIHEEDWKAAQPEETFAKLR